VPAHSDHFPWPSYYKNFDGLERILSGHSKVDEIKSLGDGLYELRRKQGDTLRLFICECYSFGVAEFVESNEKIGPLNAILISSAWCGYSIDVKRMCRDQGIGVFDTKGLMAALNRQQFWLHLTDRETETFSERGWL
jgi:hypothetical protein